MEFAEQKYQEGQGIRPCPNCHALIERSEGCDSMTCYRCGQNFDWEEQVAHSLFCFQGLSVECLMILIIVMTAGLAFTTNGHLCVYLFHHL